MEGESDRALYCTVHTRFGKASPLLVLQIWNFRSPFQKKDGSLKLCKTVSCNMNMVIMFIQYADSNNTGYSSNRVC